MEPRGNSRLKQTKTNSESVFPELVRWHPIVYMLRRLPLLAAWVKAMLDGGMSPEERQRLSYQAATPAYPSFLVFVLVLVLCFAGFGGGFERVYKRLACSREASYVQDR